MNNINAEIIQSRFDELKTEAVNAIKSIIERANALVITPKSNIVIHELSDQESLTIQEIHVEGKVVYGIFDDTENTHLYDLPMELLIVILADLEKNKFSVFEATGEDEV